MVGDSQRMSLRWLAEVHEEAYRQMKPYLGVAFFTGLLLGHSMDCRMVDAYGSVAMMVYMVFDMCLQPRMTWIYRGHHVLSIWLCMYDVWVMDRSSDENRAIRAMMFDTEWSTMMFGIAQIARRYHPAYSTIPFVLFFWLFVYYRTIRMAYVYDQYVHSWRWSRDVPISALYGLNTYWLVEMLEKHWSLDEGCMDMGMLVFYWMMVLRHIVSPIVMLTTIILGVLGMWEWMVVLFVGATWREWVRVFPKAIVSAYWTHHRKKKRNSIR